MDYKILREKMVKDYIIGRGINDKRVIRAMGKIPRHLFVDEALAARAYGDYSLPIGNGQTISNPHMVAFMTESLALKEDDQVLEIGTGSGYQTAILATLCKRVYSIERIRSLGIKARYLLSNLGYYNVTVKICDGSQGWPEQIMFNAIIVTAGAPVVPEPLVNQLADGGSLVIPIGDNRTQRIFIWRRNGENIIKKEAIDCNFVKLIGDFGWCNQNC